MPTATFVLSGINHPGAGNTNLSQLLVWTVVKSSRCDNFPGHTPKLSTLISWDERFCFLSFMYGWQAYFTIDVYYGLYGVFMRIGYVIRFPRPGDERCWGWWHYQTIIWHRNNQNKASSPQGRLMAGIRLSTQRHRNISITPIVDLLSFYLRASCNSGGNLETFVLQ